MFSIKKWLHIKVDNYILKYHSSEYIRKDHEMIQAEIKKRIDSAIDINNNQRDFQESAKLEKQALDFEIERAGWGADLEKMIEEMVEVSKMRDDILNFEHELTKKEKQLEMLISENQIEGIKMIEAVNASVGKLAKFEMTLKKIGTYLKKNKVDFNMKLQIGQESKKG